MKLQAKFSTALWMLLMLTFWACDRDSDDMDDLNSNGEVTSTSSTQNLTSTFNNNSVRDRVRGLGIGGPLGFISSRFGSATNARSENSVTQSMRSLMGDNKSVSLGRTSADSTEATSPSCYNETFTETENSYEFTLDFGSGCEFEGEFMKGKLVEKGTFTDATFKDEVTYIGFGGDNWEINGVETYEGTWSEDPLDSSTWEAAYSFTSNLVENYSEDGENVEVDYKASGTERMDQDGLTISAGEETTSTNFGEAYSSRVERPLFIDFNCGETDFFVFHSGIESGSYTDIEDGTPVSGTYSVDYGDGTCDTLITLTEDGETTEIDIAEEWDCEGDHEDEDEDDEEDDD